MFGRDAILPLNKLLQPQVQYLGNDENILLMQALKNIYEVVAQNLKIACTKITDNVNPVPTKLKEGDLVLIKDHTAKAFQPHYVTIALSPLKVIRLKFIKPKVETPLGCT